jgi:hypothetical protein
MADESITKQKLNPEELLAQLQQAQRDIQEERRQAERRVAEEHGRGEHDKSRIREHFESRIRGLEAESSALLRMLGRLQEENDRLCEEVVVFRARSLGNGEVTKGAAHATAPEAAADGEPPAGGRMDVRSVAVVLPDTPALGRGVTVKKP